MEIVLGAVVGIVAGAVVLAWRRVRGRSRVREAHDLAGVRDEMARLSERIAADSMRLGQRLEGIDSRMVASSSSSARLATDMFDALGDVRRATTTVAEQAREFTSLQDLLKAPTARGGLGEAMLEELLHQVLPPGAFDMQHRFSSGATVDAIVHAGGKIVCIDSKFPLSNYRRMCDATTDAERADAERAFAADVAKHIDDISVRYIVPDEGTLDFAVMYVPAEGLYAEVLRLYHRRKPLYESAIEARVIPMSPLTTYAYLSTVLFGLRCLSIEANAERILGFCGRLQQDMERFATDYDTLGKHIGNARSKFEDGGRHLDHLRTRLERVADFESESMPAPPLEVVPDSRDAG